MSPVDKFLLARAPLENSKEEIPGDPQVHILILGRRTLLDWKLVLGPQYQIMNVERQARVSPLLLIVGLTHQH